MDSTTHCRAVRVPGCLLWRGLVQVQVLAYRVLWTLQCEASLSAAGRDKHALAALCHHVSRQLSELVSALARVKAAGHRAGRADVKRRVISLESLITLQVVAVCVCRWCFVCAGCSCLPQPQRELIRAAFVGIGVNGHAA